MIEFVQLKDDKTQIKKVKALYKSAFPKNERPPFNIILRKTNKGTSIICAVYKDSNFAGFINVIEGKSAVYLGFFAVTKNMRGKCIGTLILEKLKYIYKDKPILVLIEELDPEAKNYTERLKRKDFYTRCGFEVCGVKIKDFGLVYDLLSCGGKADAGIYESILRPYWGKFVFRFIYKNVQ